MDRSARGEVRQVEKIQQQSVATKRVLPTKLSRSTPCMKTKASSYGVGQEKTEKDNAAHITGLAKTPPIGIPVLPQKNVESFHYSQSDSSGEETDEPIECRQQNPLYEACIKGHPALIHFLCEVGGKGEINARDLNGKTPLHYVMEAHFTNGRAELMCCLLQQGADLSLLHDQGASMVYAHYMTPELALLLMQRGLDFNSKNKFSETPLMIACDKGDAGLVKFLLGQRVSPAVTGTLGRTPLHNGKLPAEVASWLIRAGATVDAADDLGETPLMLACEAGNLPLATLLLQHGASPLAVSASGKRVLDYAKKAGGAIAGGFVLLTQQGAGCRSVQD